MSSALLSAAAADPRIQGAAKNIAGQASDKVLGGTLGGVGKLLGGKKGQRVGKKIAKGLGKVRKALLGFNAGGKVRKQPVQVVGYNAGGMVVRPLPMKRPRRPRK